MIYCYLNNRHWLYGNSFSRRLKHVINYDDFLKRLKKFKDEDYCILVFGCHESYSICNMYNGDSEQSFSCILYGIKE